jgi:hypothetical protein
MPKEFSTLDNRRQSELNSLPVRGSAADSNLLIQNMNKDNRILIRDMLTQHISLCLILMQVESLTEIYKSNDNRNEDV